MSLSRATVDGAVSLAEKYVWEAIDKMKEEDKTDGS